MTDDKVLEFDDLLACIKAKMRKELNEGR